jgi:DNA-binding transcriptional MerR regulator
MAMTDECTEQEATALAGVSAKTLRRFRESGYLDVITTSGEECLYSKRQLAEIFGSADQRQQTNEVFPAQELETVEPIRQSSCEGNVPPFESQDTEPLESQDTEPQFRESEPEVRETIISEPIQASREVERLRNLVNMQEKILDSKEAELVDLRNQRAWLRERIERLEEKAERDQILLLSETQTIRTLVSYNENRRSPVRQLLEWIGVTKQDVNNSEATSQGPRNTSTGGRTIEVRNAAND